MKPILLGFVLGTALGLLLYFGLMLGAYPTQYMWSWYTTHILAGLLGFGLARLFPPKKL